MHECMYIRTYIRISNEVHRKTDTVFLGNNMTAAGLEPPIFRSEAQAPTTKPRCLHKKRGPIKLGLFGGNDKPIRMYVSAYVRTYVCMYVCMYGCMDVCIYVCMYMYASTHVHCMYVCMYMHTNICMYLHM